MRSFSISGTVGGCFIVSISILHAQTIDSSAACSPAPKPLVEDDEPDSNKQIWLWRHAHVTGGQLTLPFKIRRSPENHTFRLTTDVTLGGYIGYTRKLSTKKDYFVTIPLTAGLTFINLNNNNTTLLVDEPEAEVVPGLTWSTGVVLQMEKYSIGLLVGKDYASNVGNQWAYHGKLWWSFGIGFVFLQ